MSLELSLRLSGRITVDGGEAFSVNHAFAHSVATMEHATIATTDRIAGAKPSQTTAASFFSPARSEVSTLWSIGATLRPGASWPFVVVHAE